MNPHGLRKKHIGVFIKMRKDLSLSCKILGLNTSIVSPLMSSDTEAGPLQQPNRSYALGVPKTRLDSLVALMQYHE